MSSKKNRAKEEREALQELARPKADGLSQAKRQIKNVGRVALIALVVIWALALGFRSGLDSMIPIYVASLLSLSAAIAAFLIRRNLKKSEEIGSLLGGSELSPEERASRIGRLEAKAEKGEASAIIAKAQLEMQDEPRKALATLETVKLDKVQKIIALQVRGMRAMIHLQLNEVAKAREIAEEMDLDKAPDPKSRANFAAVVAEAWARSGNPIEATELLDKYDESDKDFEDIKMQLLRARAFACAHRQNVQGMRKALKGLTEISPQLMAMFVGQKRVHPLLEKEAMKYLQKSGLAPKQKIQFARR